MEEVVVEVQAQYRAIGMRVEFSMDGGRQTTMRLMKHCGQALRERKKQRKAADACSKRQHYLGRRGNSDIPKVAHTCSGGERRQLAGASVVPGTGNYGETMPRMEPLKNPETRAPPKKKDALDSRLGLAPELELVWSRVYV